MGHGCDFQVVGGLCSFSKSQTLLGLLKLSLVKFEPLYQERLTWAGGGL